MNRLKNKISDFFKSRYGMDELGRTIFVASIVVYMIGVLIQNSLAALVGMIGLLIFFGRVLSGDHWERSEENRKYQSYVKLWSLRYENRKTARIYMCKNCGRYIRVPKGKGKIQITCPGCGTKIIRKT